MSHLIVQGWVALGAIWVSSKLGWLPSRLGRSPPPISV